MKKQRKVKSRIIQATAIALACGMIFSTTYTLAKYVKTDAFDYDVSIEMQRTALTLDANGGTFPATASLAETAEISSAQTDVMSYKLSTADANIGSQYREPTRPFHTFKGWASDSHAQSVEYYSGQEYAVTGNNNPILYAVWEVDCDSDWDYTNVSTTDEGVGLSLSTSGTGTQYFYIKLDDLDTNATYRISFDFAWSGYYNADGGYFGYNLITPAQKANPSSDAAHSGFASISADTATPDASGRSTYAQTCARTFQPVANVLYLFFDLTNTLINTVNKIDVTNLRLEKLGTQTDDATVDYETQPYRNRIDKNSSADNEYVVAVKVDEENGKKSFSVSQHGADGAERIGIKLSGLTENTNYLVTFNFTSNATQFYNDTAHYMYGFQVASDVSALYKEHARVDDDENGRCDTCGTCESFVDANDDETCDTCLVLLGGGHEVLNGTTCRLYDIDTVDDIEEQGAWTTLPHSALGVPCSRSFTAAAEDMYLIFEFSDVKDYEKDVVDGVTFSISQIQLTQLSDEFVFVNDDIVNENSNAWDTMTISAGEGVIRKKPGFGSAISVKEYDTFYFEATLSYYESGMPHVPKYEIYDTTAAQLARRFPNDKEIEDKYGNAVSYYYEQSGVFTDTLITGMGTSDDIDGTTIWGCYNMVIQKLNDALAAATDDDTTNDPNWIHEFGGATPEEYVGYLKGAWASWRNAMELNFEQRQGLNVQLIDDEESETYFFNPTVVRRGTSSYIVELANLFSATYNNATGKYENSTEGENTMFAGPINGGLRGWHSPYVLTAEQIEKYKTEGIRLGLLRSGNHAYLYLDDEIIYRYDLAQGLNWTHNTTNKTVDLTGDKAKVGFHTWSGMTFEIPFILDANVSYSNNQFTLLAGDEFAWLQPEMSDEHLYYGGGYGAVVSKDAYKGFYAEMTVSYDASIASGTGYTNLQNSYGASFRNSYATQQPMGFVVRFSNGKRWYPTVLMRDGKLSVEEFNVSGTTNYFNGKGNAIDTHSEIWSTSDSTLINAYKGEGVTLAIRGMENGELRVYLNGTLLHTYSDYFDTEEKSEIAGGTFLAQVGFIGASYAAQDVHYKLESTVAQEMTNSAFTNVAMDGLEDPYALSIGTNAQVASGEVTPTGYTVTTLDGVYKDVEFKATFTPTNTFERTGIHAVFYSDDTTCQGTAIGIDILNGGGNTAIKEIDAQNIIWYEELQNNCGVTVNPVQNVKSEFKNGQVITYTQDTGSKLWIGDSWYDNFLSLDNYGVADDEATKPFTLSIVIVGNIVEFKYKSSGGKTVIIDRMTLPEEYANYKVRFGYEVWVEHSIDYEIIDKASSQQNTVELTGYHQVYSNEYYSDFEFSVNFNRGTTANYNNECRSTVGLVLSNGKMVNLDFTYRDRVRLQAWGTVGGTGADGATSFTPNSQNYGAGQQLDTPDFDMNDATSKAYYQIPEYTLTIRFVGGKDIQFFVGATLVGSMTLLEECTAKVGYGVWDATAAEPCVVSYQLKGVGTSGTGANQTLHRKGGGYARVLSANYYTSFEYEVNFKMNYTTNSEGTYDVRHGITFLFDDGKSTSIDFVNGSAASLELTSWADHVATQLDSTVTSFASGDLKHNGTTSLNVQWNNLGSIGTGVITDVTLRVVYENGKIQVFVAVDGGDEVSFGYIQLPAGYEGKPMRVGWESWSNATYTSDILITHTLKAVGKGALA